MHDAHSNSPAEPFGFTSYPHACERTVPLDDVTHASLDVRQGLSNLDIRANETMPHLLRGTFTGFTPELYAAGGDVQLRHPQGPFDWLRTMLWWHEQRTSLELHPSVPWSLRVRGGVSCLTLDLARVQLDDLDISGGVSDLQLALGQPQGRVRLRMRGGASALVLSRPAGVPMRVTLHGGATHLAFDGQQLGAVGGTTRLVSPGFDDAAHSYDLELTGGASDVRVGSHTPAMRALPAACEMLSL